MVIDSWYGNHTTRGVAFVSSSDNAEIQEFRPCQYFSSMGECFTCNNQTYNSTGETIEVPLIFPQNHAGSHGYSDLITDSEGHSYYLYSNGTVVPYIPSETSTGGMLPSFSFNADAGINTFIKNK